MLRITRAVAAVAVAAVLVLSGCAADPGGTGTANQTLTLGITAAPASFDTKDLQMQGAAATTSQAVYDTLFEVSSTGEVTPSLAEKYEYDEARTKLTLTLRDDVTFTDGSKLTAGVVKANVDRYKGAVGVSDLVNVTAVEAPDEHTVVFTLSAPDPALLFSLGLVAIASGDALEGSDLASKPVGSGPYVLDANDTVAGTTYTYTKNDDYWNKDAQHYDKVVIRVLNDPTAQLNAVKAGEVNALRLLNNDGIAEVEGAGWQVTGIEADFQGLLLMDRDGKLAPELADVRVRQALNYAFDRKALLKVLQGDRGTVTEQIFPESSAAFDESLNDTYSYDPDEAKKLLAEAGYADGFTLTIPTNPAFGNTLYTLLAQQLSDVGITANLVDAGTNHTTEVTQGKYPVAYMSLGALPNDYKNLLAAVSPNTGWNPFHTQTPELDAILKRVQTGDEKESAAAAKEANEYLVDQAWFAPWFRRELSIAHDAQTQVDLTSLAVPSLKDFSPKS